MSSDNTISLVPPAGPLIGSVTLPGSKSITNRALLLAALADGQSRLTGALKSDDTMHMAEALRRMGVGIEEPDDTTYMVTGTGGLTVPDGPLFLGNAGTAMRFLTAVSVLAHGTVVLTGDAYMQTRPIQALVDALAHAGVTITATNGSPPVRIEGAGRLDVKRFEIDGQLSSQFVSALLMLAACGEEPIEVRLTGNEIGARGYIDITLACMRAFGAEAVQVAKQTWRVSPGGYTAGDIVIEPDASAATYLWAMEALTSGHIALGNQALTQPDAAAYPLIRSFPQMPRSINGSQMQDAVPTLAVLAAFNEWPVRFTGVANLRVKECDRLQALHAGLNAISPGLATLENDDLIIDARPQLAGTRVGTLVETHGDHRMAMSFALAGLRVGGVLIRDPGCVAKTFPGYWDTLVSLGVELV
ncbi:3-phosphoshikimate 1-carboxyvinyltransferase [Pseudomonas sp. G34]|uniref:3-phosphoshikimate 1-carboxyvinyltransferase n=1 Tax=Pseudomonas sp. G34 TaxID=3059083 RepID=UPI00280750E2|nr:3-phosphoshikimate 1-carboxyvinyltransferase [Pseudomonas sp. G34]MDQ7986486.1 3-phosphoshikimate 1-carboxyvinyltransferase [Pseudomonas sp. G34]